MPFTLDESLNNAWLLLIFLQTDRVWSNHSIESYLHQSQKAYFIHFDHFRFPLVAISDFLPIWAPNDSF